jgi:NaMN:DMB phosphoribosyltransferase
MLTSLPAGLPSDYAARLTTPPVGKRPAVARIQLLVERDTHTWYRPQLGTIPLETAKELTVNRVVLPVGATPSHTLISPFATNFNAAMITIPNQRVTLERAADPRHTNR